MHTLCTIWSAALQTGRRFPYLATTSRAFYEMHFPFDNGNKTPSFSHPDPTLTPLPHLSARISARILLLLYFYFFIIPFFKSCKSPLMLPRAVHRLVVYLLGKPHVLIKTLTNLFIETLSFRSMRIFLWNITIYKGPIQTFSTKNICEHTGWIENTWKIYICMCVYIKWKNVTFKTTLKSLEFEKCDSYWNWDIMQDYDELSEPVLWHMNR